MCSLNILRWKCTGMIIDSFLSHLGFQQAEGKCLLALLLKPYFKSEDGGILNQVCHD